MAYCRQATSHSLSQCCTTVWRQMTYLRWWSWGKSTAIYFVEVLLLALAIAFRFSPEDNKTNWIANERSAKHLRCTSYVFKLSDKKHTFKISRKSPYAPGNNPLAFLILGITYTRFMVASYIGYAISVMFTFSYQDLLILTAFVAVWVLMNPTQIHTGNTNTSLLNVSRVSCNTHT